MAKDEDVTIWDCPKCSTGKLVKRKNKQQEAFYGCTNFPECRYTQPCDEEKEFEY
ncbi:MAG: topoisomerase DNA-binding C4 zinc finger domain-containing protein [Nitrospirae bacterium]|nr:topoisomerase DNA-binding C4 zinc finger domain-containing protein [Nitrospirota bacterium]